MPSSTSSSNRVSDSTRPSGDDDRTVRPSGWHWTVASAAILAFMVALGLKQVWIGVYDPVHEDHYLTLAHDDLLQDRGARVLVVGTSHMRTGLNPEWAGVPLVSLNHPALDYVSMERLLQTHENQLDRFAILAIDLDVFALEVDTIAYVRESVALHRMGMSVWDYDAPIHRRFKLFMRQQIPFYSPGVNPQSLQERFWPSGPTVEAGYRGSHQKMTAKERGDQRAISHQNAFRHFPNRAAANRQALLRMVELARKHHMQCILLRMPHEPSYWETLDEMYQNRFYELIAELQTFDHVDVWDYDDPAQISLKPFEDFRDGDHLNEQGAKKFSEAFGQRLQALLDAKQMP